MKQVIGKIFYCFSFVLWFLISSWCIALDIGSDNIVTRFVSVQSLSNGDRVAGFAALDGGFFLASIISTSSFDSFFPVTGDVSFNRGSLVLDRDLIFRDIAIIKSIGSIDGQGHVMELSASTTCIPSPDIGNCAAVLADEASQPDPISTIDWSFDNTYIALGMDTQGGSNDILRVYKWSGSLLTLEDSEPLDVYLDINNVRWSPFKHQFVVTRKSSVSTDELITFSFVPLTGMIHKVSSVDIGVDALAAAWNPTGDYIAVGVAKNPEIEIYSVDVNGVISASPVETINISGNKVVQRNGMEWSELGDYLAVATDKQGGQPELLIYEWDSGLEMLTLNASYVAGARINAIDWSATPTNQLVVGVDGTSEKLRVVEHNNGAGTITLLDSSTQPGNPVIRSVGWAPNGNCIVTGWTNGDFRTFEFDQDVQELIEVSNVKVNNKIEAEKKKKNGLNLAIGGENKDLGVYRTQASFVNDPDIDDCVEFTDLKILLNCNTCIQRSCINFKGESSIDGRGTILTLESTTTLIIDANASLLLKDVVIQGINSERIQMTDSTSTLSLDNVEWVQDGDYNFKKGHFDVLGQWRLVGEGNIFAYQTDQASTIDEYGHMIIDNELTFSYDPSNFSRDLIILATKNSKIELNGGSFHTTTSGIMLKKGILRVDRKSTLSAEGTTNIEGISIGDGVDVNNNVTVQILPSAQLILERSVVDDSV